MKSASQIAIYTLKVLTYVVCMPLMGAAIFMILIVGALCGLVYASGWLAREWIRGTPVPDPNADVPPPRPPAPEPEVEPGFCMGGDRCLCAGRPDLKAQCGNWIEPTKVRMTSGWPWGVAFRSQTHTRDSVLQDLEDIQRSFQDRGEFATAGVIGFAIEMIRGGRQ